MINSVWGPLEQFSWLDGGGHCDGMVISTRVRLARNLAGYPFLHAEPKPRGGRSREILDLLSRGVSDLGELLPLQQLDRVELLFLRERELISGELARSAGKARGSQALLITPEATVMINEEDHLRIQAMVPGFDPELAWGLTDRLEADLGKRFDFAFHPEFGYLTSCPTNVGTGLRASVLLHLPGLIFTRELEPLARGLGQLKLTRRGWHGEGTDSLGHLVQLSNQTTLGTSEAGLLNHLAQRVRQVMGYEQSARQVLQQDAGRKLEDLIWRAWGALTSARRMALDESLEKLSMVRLGLAMGEALPVSHQALNQLLVLVQPANLLRATGCKPDQAILEVERAGVIRQELEQKGKYR